MKTKIIGIMLVLGFVCGAFAELKIGYINSEEIFMKYKGTRDAQKKFDKIATKVQQEATDRKKEIEMLKEQLERQSLLLSDERKKEQEQKIKRKVAEFEKFVSENYGRDGKIISKNAEMTKPIIEKINKIIERISKEEHFDLILDARMGGIVYAKKKYDLSGRIIKILNKE